MEELTDPQSNEKISSLARRVNGMSPNEEPVDKDKIRACREEYEKFANFHGARPKGYVTDPELFRQFISKQYDFNTRAAAKLWLKQLGVTTELP